MIASFKAFPGGESVVFGAGAGEGGVAAEQAVQEILRQEAGFGTHRPEFLVGAWHLGQRSGSARSGRIGTSDTQTIDKWFIFELMRIVSWQLLDPLLGFFWVAIAC